MRTINGRLGAVLGSLAVGLSSVAWVVAAPAAHASPSNLAVYVGYADSFHSSPSSFPAPWDGSSGVTFVGCGDCSYDGGAVRLVNNSGATMSVDDVKVHVSTCTFDLWGSNSIPAGGQLIVAQTLGGADNGCSSNGHMDTSDVGPGGSGYAGNCTPDGIVPTVDVTVSGSTSTFSDTAQVINTGGFDTASCPPPGSNESNQWTLVGTEACAGSTLTLAPASQDVTLTEGAQATVTATLANSCGTGLSGVSVGFSVLSGPNTGTTGTAVTDSNGNATFSYGGATVGTDTVQASVTDTAGTLTSNTVTVNWSQQTVTTCPPGTTTCASSTTVPNQLTTLVKAKSTTGGTITVTIGQDTLNCGDSYAHAPFMTTLTSTNISGRYKYVTLIISHAFAGRTSPHQFKICYESSTPFVDINGNTIPPGTPGIIPNCGAFPVRPNPLPCLQEVFKASGPTGAIYERFFVPASDPKFF